MVYCCIPTCLSKYKKGCGLSFHELPSNMELRKKWIKSIGRKRGNSDYDVVCSKHFNDEDFSKAISSRRRLLPYAVPSIFDTDQRPLKSRSGNIIKQKEAIDRIMIPASEIVELQEVSESSVPSPLAEYIVVPIDHPSVTDSCTSLQSSDATVKKSVNHQPVAKSCDSLQPTNTFVQQSVSQVPKATLLSDQKINNDEINYQITIIQDPLELQKYGFPQQDLCSEVTTSPVAKWNTQQNQDGVVISRGTLHTSVNGSNKPPLKCPPHKKFSKNICVDKCTQADFRMLQSPEIKQWKRRLREMEQKVEKFREDAKSCRTELQSLKSDPYLNNVLKMKEESETHKTLAIFLLDQIYNYALVRPQWTRTTLTQSISLRNISSELYQHLRNSNLLKLPGQATLAKYEEEVENKKR